MKIIIGEPGQGKTKRLLEVFIEDTLSMMVVFCNTERQRIIDMFQKEGRPLSLRDQERLVTFDWVLNHKPLTKDKTQIIVDNIETAMQRFFESPIRTLSLTKWVMKKETKKEEGISEQITNLKTDDT